MTLTRIQRLRELMAHHALESLLVTHDVNRNYLTGFTGSSGALLLTPHKSIFVTDSRYTSQAAKQVKDAEIVLQKGALLSDMVALIKKQGCRQLGVEAMQVTIAQYDFLAGQLGKKVELVKTRSLVETLRAGKDPVEKRLMLQAARITDRCFYHITGFIRPGLKEVEVAAEMEHFMRRQGASGPSFDTIVASGWRGALPHGIASEKKIERGDLVVIDFGCIYQGYCSDMTRTIGIGKVTPAQKKVYNLVRRAQQASIDVLKTGVISGFVDEKSRGMIRRAGYGKHYGHGLGHGVGMEVHETPNLGPNAKHKMEENVAVTVEPGVYLEGRFGVRIEDLGFVTKNGYDNLYRATKELVVV